MLKPIEIIRATTDHIDGVWKIFHEVIQTGDTYAYPPDTTKEEMISGWFSKNVATYVALLEGKIAGVYILKPNYIGLGSHVANCSYMVDATFRGQKIGRRMAEHSFEEARKQGYLSMQYNIVVSTNTTAVELWKSVGFKIIGTSPKAFRHLKLGLVDTYVMHRFL